MGFVRQTPEGRFFVTDEGAARHASEVLKIAQALPHKHGTHNLPSVER